jgi:hypothetical protein
MLTEKAAVGYKMPVMEARQRTGIERKGDAILVCRRTISAELPGDAAPKWSADAAGDDPWLRQIAVEVCRPPLRLNCGPNPELK